MVASVGPLIEITKSGSGEMRPPILIQDLPQGSRATMDQRHEPSVAEHDLATRLAFERTYLAHERTQMAWVRTSLALITFGFGIAKFVQIGRAHV